MSLNEQIDKAAKAIFSAGRLTCFTGAGISVDSGIPDFRSPGGLWEKYDPGLYCDYGVFKRKPELFWRMARELVLDIHLTNGGTEEDVRAGNLRYAQPNESHRALKDLEDMKLLTTVMTQNIDGLHTKAGNMSVIEIHGTDSTSSCMQCSHKVPQQHVVNQWVASMSSGRTQTSSSVEALRQSIQTDGFVPKCEKCRGVLKADVTFFGEGLPAGALWNSMTSVLGAGVCLVIGSSLQVVPANMIPSMVKWRFGTMIVLNADESGKDSAHIHIQGSATEVMPRLVQCLRDLQEEKNRKSGCCKPRTSTTMDAAKKPT
eukprot:GEMP01053712.1.p1 GENE.GEMP01053712.1~~GEMP01053712.1.p1  ORF type:complete len:339 (+),score=58.41 GEMP01053712.1:71-1018(+)